MSKKAKGASKRETLLATLTLITTLLTVLGTANTVYSGWVATKEKEEQSQAEKLQNQIEYARQLLPACNLTPAEKTETNSTLTNALNELRLHDDTQAAKTLFDSVSDRLVNCPVPEPVSRSIVTFPLILLALVSIVLALAWRSERRRNKAVPSA